MQTDLVYSNMSPATLSKPKGSCLRGLEGRGQHQPNTTQWSYLLAVTDVCPCTEEGWQCQCLPSGRGSSPFPSLLWDLAGDWGRAGQSSVSGIEVCHS